MAPLLVAALLPSHLWSQAAQEPQSYLRRVGFSEAELADLEKGSVVARVIPERDDNDADVLAVAWIRAKEEALVEGLRRIETFKSGETVLQIGRFSTPPKLEDVQSLVFDPEDLDDFGKCQAAECEIQAPSGLMDLGKKIDWKSPAAKTKATQLLKEAMVHEVETYVDQGSSAMVVYNNNLAPVSVKAEIEKILQNSPNLAHYNPDFVQYLLTFPKGAPPNVEDFLYWSKEKLRRPVVSMAHVCIQKVVRGADTLYFIAMKHIYDSHYFLADIEFLTLVPAGGEKGGFYLLHDIRAHIDPPRKFRGLLLGKIKSAMKDALADVVRNTKRRLEAFGGKRSAP